MDVGHPRQANKVLGNELWLVVGDDAGCDVGMTLGGALEDEFDLGLLHGVAESPYELWHG